MSGCLWCGFLTDDHYWIVFGDSRKVMDRRHRPSSELLVEDMPPRCVHVNFRGLFDVVYLRTLFSMLHAKPLDVFLKVFQGFCIQPAGGQFPTSWFLSLWLGFGR